MTGTPKIRYPRAEAIRVAREVAARLKPGCLRIMVAGSLRRGQTAAGDVEILYIPRTEWCRDPGDFFASGEVNLADRRIAEMESQGILSRRTNVNGSTVFGPKNKLMEHCASGIPVDLFSTDESCWENYKVCRTGPAESNTRIAMAAQKRGWRWTPYGAGFIRDGSLHPISCEADVFRFVGLPQPPKRTEIEL
jgi:DNA polymerase/3'-5' exonuclease PolX